MFRDDRCLCIIAAFGFLSTVVLSLGAVYDILACVYVACGMFYSVGFMLLVTCALSLDTLLSIHSDDPMRSSWVELGVACLVIFISFPVSSIAFCRPIARENLPSYLYV